MKRLYYILLTGIMLALVFQSAIGQNVTVNSTVLTTGLSASPLIGGSTTRVIFGFQLDKAAGGSNTVTKIVVSVNGDPTTTLVSANLHRSTNTQWDGPEPIVSNGVLNNSGATPANSIVFDPIGPATEIHDYATGGAASAYFFVVVTVRDDVSTSPTTPAITLSLNGANVTTSTGTVTGTTTSNPSYNFQALSTTIAQETGGVVANVTPGDTQKAIIGFSATSNGGQTLDDIEFTLNVDPSTGPLENFKLVNNGASSSYSGGGTILGTVPVLTATTVTFNNIAQAVTASPTYFFLIADVDVAATTPSTFTTTLSNTTATTSITTGDGFSEGPINIQALTATLTQESTGIAASPLEAGQTNQAVLGFDLVSNGSQTVSEIVIQTNTNPATRFTSFALVSSADNSFSTTGDNSTAVTNADIAISGSGPYSITITPAAPLPISASDDHYFFLTGTVNSSVTSAMSAIQFSIDASDITVAPTGLTTNSFNSPSYSFTASEAVLSVAYVGQSTLDISEYSKQTAVGLTTVNSERIFGLTIEDGDSDSHSTTINQLVLEIGDPANLKTIALFDNASSTLIPGTELDVATVIDGSNRITFSGLNYIIADGTVGAPISKTIDVRVTFAAAITDNDQVSVLVYSMTAASSGTIIGPLGTLQTGGTNNDFDVVATKLIFNTLPIQEVPATNFTAIVWATDANNNIDVNVADQVGITESGPGAGNLSGGGNISPVNGVYTFNSLSIDLAGTYNVTAADAGGGLTLTDAAGSINITSLGVQISDGIGPNPLTLNLCYGGNFVPLGSIVIEESDPADFATGGIFILELPSGFVFNTAVNPSVSETGSEVTINSLGTYFIGNSIVRISYSVSGTSTLDGITIANLQVRYPSTTSTPGGDIHVLDASAQQVGNTEADLKNHGTLTASATDPTGYTFIVNEFPGENNILDEETKFSYNIAGVILKPDPDNPATTNNAFSGNGVSYSATLGEYVFSPASVGVGSNYVVTFTGINASGCLISVSKTFQVYANSITGLQQEYCINDNTTQSLSVDPSRYDIAPYYSPWNALQSYGVGWRVNYNNEAYESIVANIGIIPTNTAFWKKVGYTFTGDYAIVLPSYKTISSVNNNGSGTITITSNNHGFTNGATINLQYYVYDAFFTTLLFYVPYAEYTVTAATTNTFVINYIEPNAGTYTTGYGGIYLQNPPVTSVTVVSNTISIGINNHGLSNGSEVLVFLNGLSNNGGVSTRIYDWFTVTNATSNSFDIVSPTAVSGAWTGYGYVDTFTHRISSFTPSMVTNLNQFIKSPTEVYVGFIVNQIGCSVSATNTCNQLVYTYEPVKINQLAQLDFTGLISPAEYCAGQLAVTLTGNQTDGSFTGNGITDGGANSNTASFNPSSGSITQGVPFNLTYSYTDTKNCSNSVSKSVIVNVTPVPPTPSQAEFGYCQNDTQALILKVSGTGSEFSWYNNSSKSILLGKGPVYDASSAGTGSPTTIAYFATQFANGCESVPAQVDLVINPLPDADFTSEGQCVNDPVQFTGPTTNVATWNWDFGDGNFSTDTNPVNIFDNSRTYSIRLDVVSVPLAGGAICRNSNVTTLFIGFNPEIKFGFNRICDGDNTVFAYTSNPPLDSVFWNFGDGTITKGEIPDAITGVPNTSGTYENPVHQYPSYGTYTVELTGKTAIGCESTVTRQLPILIKLAPTPTDPYFMVNADPIRERGYWQPESTDDNTITWEFNTAQGTILNKPDSMWITNATGPYKPLDVSYVNSPCFDISSYDRPLIAFDFINDTQFSRDGAILEYSTNSGISWTRLGNPTTGLEWYNATPVNALGNVFGWTGVDQDYKEAAHSLSSIPLADRSQLRFRIKFASDLDTEGEGFGFRNVRIIEKNRRILVENFTNSAETSTLNHNTVFRNLDTFLSPSEYVPLEYHIQPAGFGEDPINQQNRPDQNARAAFYGITQDITSVQDGLLQGNLNNAPNSTNLSSSFSDEFNLRSLDASAMIIDIATSINADQELQVDATITPTEPVLAQPNQYTSVYIALIEKVITDPLLAGQNGETEFRYVLRKFLPSASGTPLQLPLTTGIPVTISESIPVTGDLFSDINELGVIVFIQEQNTVDGRKEVLQAAIETSPIVPPIVTGTESDFAKQLLIYPNPAKSILNIKLPEVAKSDTPITLIDNLGRVVYDSRFRTGEQTKAIPTSDFTNGFYLLKVKSNTGDVAFKKVIISN